MGQVAAALLFVAAFGFGLTVILAMLKINSASIISALSGEGAFPITAQPESGPTLRMTAQRRTLASRDAAWSKPQVRTVTRFSRAAA